MQINEDGLEELYRGLYKELIEDIANIILSTLAEEDKAAKIEERLKEYRVIK